MEEITLTDLNKLQKLIFQCNLFCLKYFLRARNKHHHIDIFIFFQKKL